MKQVYENGTILSLRGEERPECVCVRDGTIEKVCAKTDLPADYSGAQVKDLRGRTMIPAFIDPHSHLSAVATGFLQVSAASARSFQELGQLIRDDIGRRNIKPGEWVMVKDYDPDALMEKKHPAKEILDAFAPRNPVLLQHVSGHCGVVNTQGLSALHIARDTPQPEGGSFGRTDGELNGYLEENAYIRSVQQIPMPDMNALGQAFTDAQKLYASHGIATVQEGMLVSQMAPLYQALIRNHGLYLDVIGYADIREAEKIEESLKGLENGTHFRLGGYKAILDGSPQARTAWMREPYLGEAEYRGYPAMTDEAVEKAFRFAWSRRRQILMHCNGDAAAEQMIRAALKLEEEGLDIASLRPVVIHAQLLGRDQLAGVKAAGILPSFFIAHVYHWGDTHLKNFGARAETISPAASALREGIRFTFHQDSPVIAPDMLETIACAVCRKTKKNVLLGGDEKISVWDALRAVTVNAAYQYFEEGKKGTLEKGKNADFAILDQDPTETEPDQIGKIRVLETIRRGETIWKA